MTFYHTFWHWFKEQHRSLRSLSASEAADRIERQIRLHNSQLGAEISDDDDNLRELTITAGGNESMFAIVEELVGSAPHLPTWKFVALKPPRGFDFKVSFGSTEIKAQELKFIPLQPSSKAIALGIRIYIPDGPRNAGDSLKSIANIIIETGAGERLSSCVDHLDVVSAVPPPQSLPIKDLPRYIEWFIRRYQ